MSNRIVMILMLTVLIGGQVAKMADVDLEIQMPSNTFWPGAVCWLEIILDNTGSEDLDMVQLFVALNLGTDDYWFCPSWVKFPGDVDWLQIDIPAHSHQKQIILPDFIWPDGTGTFSGAHFISLLVDGEDVKSNMDDFSFGWTNIPEATPTPPPIDGYSFIPPGTFLMGSSPHELCRQQFEDIHEVNLTKGFYAKTFEVTQEEWLVFFHDQDLTWQNLQYPMYAMTWFDAVAYCNQLSVMSGLTPTYYSNASFSEVFFGEPPITSGSVYWNHNADGFRLPTESEWEYMCRAETASAYNSGKPNTDCYGNDRNLDPLAWYANTQPHETGLKLPNQYGLFDMHGNSSEWCWDWFEEVYPYGTVTDPVGPDTGVNRVNRGGEYLSDAGDCRSASRNNHQPGLAVAGLRCICSGLPQSTRTPIPSETPLPTSTYTATNTPLPSNTPTSTSVPTETPTITVTPTPTIVPTAEPVCVMTCTTFPYIENFDSGFGDWQQSQIDDRDWTHNSGNTPSDNTGPSGDHTTGSGFYLYTEATENLNMLFVLYGVCFDRSSLDNPEFQFYYHMHGAYMGNLVVQASDNGGLSWNNLWSVAGDQGDEWHQVIIDVSQYPNPVISIRIVAETGSDETSDIAIDDLYFGEYYHPTLTPTYTPTPTMTPTNTPTFTPSNTPTQTATPTYAPQPVSMVSLFPGSFTMGSPLDEMCHESDENLHDVNLSAGYRIQINEVTQLQWLMVFDENPSSNLGEYKPVESVTWFDVCVFCNRMSELDGYTPCYYSDQAYQDIFDGTPPITNGTVFWDQTANGYRLPSEAEWEYACRSTTTTSYNNGLNGLSCIDSDSNLDPIAWYGENSLGEYHETMQKDPNIWGIYDMHGNVREWCWDWYEAVYPSGTVTNPIGPETGDHRVCRGGNYSAYPSACRSADRDNILPGNILVGTGLRLAKNLH